MVNLSGVSVWTQSIPHFCDDDMLSCTQIFRDCVWCQMKMPGVYTALQDKDLKKYR